MTVRVAIRLFLIVIAYAQTCWGEVWTSIRGERLEGLFIGYQIQDRKIFIRRDYDRQLFAIDEAELILSDRLRAVRLQNPDMRPYWYTDYDEAKEKPENRGRPFVLLCANGSDAVAFELFYHKLLLREEFRALMQEHNFVACVQEQIPDSIRLGANSHLNNDAEYKRWVRENLPMVYCGISDSAASGENSGIWSWFRLRVEGKALREGNDFTPYRHLENAVRGYGESSRKSVEEIRALTEKK